MKNAPVSIDKLNLTILLIALLIAGGVGFLLPYLQSRKSGAPTITDKHASIVIEHTQNGFVPETITVPVGSTVGWTNSSGGPMWVGSDPHPAHTDLPGFDQLEVIAWVTPYLVSVADAHGGGTYEYTFTKVGIWKYHNHINPAERGTVVVVEKTGDTGSDGCVRIGSVGTCQASRFVYGRQRRI